MAKDTTQDRSPSGEPGEFDSDGESPGTGGKPGRKKNPNSQAARRDQNRIAQREFRLRKQQRIRDLEARVEILSGGKDEALASLTGQIKDLMEENVTLRGLLKSLSGFIGDGVGGVLPKMGWQADDFNNFVNKSETDTAWESFQRRKKDGTGVTATTSANATGKRPSEDDAGTSRKRPREHEAPAMADPYASLVPMNAGGPSNPPQQAQDMFPPGRGPHGLFNELMRGPEGPMFMQPPPNSSPYGGPQPPNPYQSGYSTNMTDSPLSFSNGTPQPGPPALGRPDELLDHGADDPKKLEAYKLVHYHLDNYKRNPAYCLPSSLRPTLVQRTVPHESVIDQILHPELRDRMILLRGRFDLVDCLHDYRTSMTIHGDDVLVHTNWEIGEKWLRLYGFLIDQSTLNITNRWRRERGENELTMEEVTPGEAPA